MLRALITATLLSVGAVSASSSDFQSPVLVSDEHDSCPADSPLSCSTGSDSCCSEQTNGLFLQTQFWDYNPTTGPDNVWTIHGLWSDKCSGGFNQFCNPSWEISDPTSILQGLGETDLLNTMNTYWKNNDGTDASLWEHEFNKHGTCMATVNPDCYSSDAAQYQYVGDFYNAVVKLWQTLPSYEFLTAAGITPSSSATYTVSQFKSALSSHVNGADVYLGCDSNNAITEIWYFFHLQGAVADGTFIPTDSVSSSTCQDGFQWLPKSGGSDAPEPSSDPTTSSDAPTQTSTTTPTQTSSPGSGTSKGYLEIQGQQGCLISDGSWYVSGTCATFTVDESSSGVTVTSSKGPCDVNSSGQFVCGSSESAGQFSLDNGSLAYNGETTWSADSTASGYTKTPVYTGSGSVSFEITFSSS